MTTVTDLARPGRLPSSAAAWSRTSLPSSLQSFADCLERQLVTQPANASSAVAAAEPTEPRPVSGLALGATAMRNMIGRHKRLTAALWASFFFLYLWLGMLAIDVSSANAFIFGAPRRWDLPLHLDRQRGRSGAKKALGPQPLTLPWR